MALIIGSLFSGQKPTAADARNYFGVSFLSMMFLSMGAMPEMGITFASKPCAPFPLTKKNCASLGGEHCAWEKTAREKSASARKIFLD